MSFSFQWPRFSDQFHADAIQMLEAALNKGSKPPVIADRIQVVELEMGSQPPELEIRDIGDLTTSQFRGIFRLTYAGDAHIVLKTKVQANPLYHKKPDLHLMGGSRGMLAANQPLVVPMHLRLSNFKLNSYVVLVVSKQKGITLVFKTDPLQNVDISSTFDSIAVIQRFIQTEIEGQLRQMFREDLPGIIHRLSQQWVRATTVEAPYLDKQPKLAKRNQASASNPDIARSHLFGSPLAHPQHSPLRHQSQYSVQPSSPRTQFASSRSVSGMSHRSSPQPNRPQYAPTFDDSDDDSDAGHTTERSGFSGLGRLYTDNRGLADLTEEANDTDEVGSFDAVDWEDTARGSSPSSMSGLDETEYESVPAVGGGTITRPRVYHSPSLLRVNSGSTLQPSGSSATATPAFHRMTQSFGDTRQLHHRQPYSARSSPPRRPAMSMQAPYFGHDTSDEYAQASSSQLQKPVRDEAMEQPIPTRRSPRRVHTPDASQSATSRSSSGPLGTPPGFLPDARSVPIYEPPSRRLSVSSAHTNHNSSNQLLNGYTTIEPDGKIVLRPGLNNAISQLSLLNFSNQTLSPYTRALEHFTVRSLPPKALDPSRTSTPMERQPVKAKRKRTYRVGRQSKAGPVQADTPLSRPLSPIPPSEFDPSEVDRYFRANDEFTTHFPETYTPHLRRRTSAQTMQ